MSIRPYRDIVRRKSPPDHGRQRAGRRRRADHRADDDQHADRATPRRPSTRSARCEEAGADIVRVSCPDEDVDRGAEGHRQGGEGADRRRHPFPLQARASRRPMRARPACASIPAISARADARARSGRRRPRTMAARCASASMPARWRRICWRSMASPAPRRWSKARSIHAKHPAGPRLPRIQDRVKASDLFLAVAAYQQLAEAGRLPAASRHHRGRRPASPARSSRRSAWARCCGPASATRSASRCRPSRRKKCASASRS